MRFDQGATLGVYEILSLLGAGGMGEVYRARDPRLGREVAIKVLPEALAGDGERVARFEREARSLAALNHPNVATLHGFEADGACRFLVMELVEGEDLAARIARGPIPVVEAIPLFLQIAEGLEAAHEKGILHRDLKPANVKVGPDGRVKILDFGLAKAMVDEHATAGGAGSLGDLTHSPTLTAQATRAGTLLGTAAYMSPEQARGIPADARADVWAFGCCFFEALTAKRPFAGEDAPQTLASVLKDTPDWSELPADLPRHLAVLLRRCLEKNRRARVQSAGDLRVELHETLAPPSAVAPSAFSADAAGDRTRDRVSARWRRRGWLLASSAALIALAIGFLLGRRAPGAPSATPPEAPVVRVPVALPTGVEIPYGYTRRLAISPDGRRVAFVGRSAAGQLLYVQDLDQAGTARPVGGTEGATTPFFSPDGDSLGFLRRGINVVPLGGGEPRTLAGASLTGGNAAWLEDGWIVYSDGTGGVNRVAAAGGSPQVLLEPVAGEEHYSAQYLPGREHLLHQVLLRDHAVSTVVATSVASGERTVLFEGGVAPRYVSSGHLLVVQEDLLLAMTLDARTLEVGRPVPVLRGLSTDVSEDFGDFAVSDSGTLVYLTGALEQEGWLVRLTPDGKRERLSRRPADFDYLPIAVSPDGGRVALARNDWDIWIFDLASRDLEVRVTTHPAQRLGADLGAGRRAPDLRLREGRRLEPLLGVRERARRRRAAGRGAAGHEVAELLVARRRDALLLPVQRRDANRHLAGAAGSTRSGRAVSEDALQRVPASRLARRRLGRVWVGRVGNGGDLRHVLSRSRHQEEGLARRRRRPAMERGRRSPLLPLRRSRDGGPVGRRPGTRQRTAGVRGRCGRRRHLGRHPGRRSGDRPRAAAAAGASPGAELVRGARAAGAGDRRLRADTAGSALACSSSRAV